MSSAHFGNPAAAEQSRPMKPQQLKESPSQARAERAAQQKRAGRERRSEEKVNKMIAHGNPIIGHIIHLSGQRVSAAEICDQ